ncbi:Ig-like domain-containing protein [Paenibacillus terrigena]|uniref:Ig-like domain-containing protein n=1 Tax=Paenibacillus terrigena TaxID=369333 RepID=UPI00037C61B3|nr:Ig-like domain-containing protein [Paenibacillus terrigena]
MSNKSYNLSKNYKVKDIQGGEIKVMKKFLSIALSTAMAFSMFASVAFGADNKELSTQDKYDALTKAGIFSGYPDGTAGLDKNMTRGQFAKVVAKLLTLEDDAASASKYVDVKANNWAAPFIGSVSKAGLMEGSKNQKGQLAFDFNGNVTVEQMAKVLVIALKLEVPATAENGASVWAKGYVDAAVKAGLIPADANFKAAATREQLVLAAYTASVEIEKAKVSYEVKVVDANNIQVTFSDAKDKPESFKLEKALEANKENTVTVKRANGEEKTLKFTWTVTDATKVESVKADNLREVQVAFDGEVDSITANDESNYSLKGDGNPKVISVSLSADKKVATLTVERGDDKTRALTNQKEYKLSVANVRAGSKVITANDVAFTPVDATLPVATKTEALGNKAVRITFSEPIRVATSNNFKIDGKNVAGTVDITGSTVIFKPFNKMENAEHTLTVSGVEDYSGLKNLSTDLKFTVVEDTTPPTISSVVKASFEKVTLKFSEAIDKSTVLASNVYWTQGDSKKRASKVNVIADDTYEFEFNTSDRLLYTTNLYVTGVKDYSGNVIANDAKIEVNPVVDTTRPEVVTTELKDDMKTITVKFSKSLDKDSAQKTANFVVKNSDGKEVSVLKTATLGTDGKTVTVYLYQKLEGGKKYTLEVSGVSDNTTLKNVMMPFTKALDVADKAQPKVDGVTYDGQKVIVTYSKAMKLDGEGSITEKKNYLYKDKDGKPQSLPSGAYIDTTPDGKSAIIVFPSELKPGVDVTGIKVQLVKDAADNFIEGFSTDMLAITQASAIGFGTDAPKSTSNVKIEVPFNQVLQSGSAYASDFNVKTKSYQLDVINAEVDGKNVVLTLSDNTKLDADGLYKGEALDVTVKANSSLATPAGKQVTAAITSAIVLDGIAPSVDSVSLQATASVTQGTYVDVKFTEAVVLVPNAKYDFEVKIDGDVVSPDVFNVTAVDAKTVRVTVPYNAKQLGKMFDVRVKPNAIFIKDATRGNVVSGSDKFSQAYIPETATN